MLATLGVLLCLGVALRRIRVESDLTLSIPAGSPVLETGRKLLRKHPVVDRVAIDLSLRDGSTAPDRLVEAADHVQKMLGESGLFSRVGTADWAAGLASLHASVAERLPTLFSTEELHTLVEPRLGETSIRAAIAEDYAELAELEGIGQARAVAADPLELRSLVYARLAALLPKTDVRIEQNHLVSADGRHLLVTAEPHRSAGDPESSRRIAELLDRIGNELDQIAASGHLSPVRLTATGAYRAAMDNEQIVKRDTNRAVWLVTVAVALLLFVCFSRPVLGLLTLLPATAGVAGALLVYSLFSRNMSALALGFGGALISITVDQGIVYVAYLDRVRGSSGKQAARQTFSSVSLATLTTVGAFFALTLSGYRLLAELGVFAALGSAFSFVFVHTVFPLVFRTAPTSERRPILPVDAWLRRIAAGRASLRVVAAMALMLGLGAFARPRFEVELHRMNTVTAATRTAEAEIKQIWGDLFSRAYVLVEATSLEDLGNKADDLARLLAGERAAGRITAGFSPSLLWPGPKLAQEHLAAWREFWRPDRREHVIDQLARAAREAGFAEDAFDPFVRAVRAPEFIPAPLPSEAFSLLGVAHSRDGQGLVWLGALERGPAYDAVLLSHRATEHGLSLFDGREFGRSLNAFLQHAFLRMLSIVAPFVLVAVVLSFVAPRLVGVVLAPVGFGLVCTLGTLGLLGRPIDIPGLMLGVVVLGMGTNFSVYLVRAHQRHPDPGHPVHDSVRVAALLDGGATVLGMSVMLSAEHAAARSAGLVGVLGIGFSLGAALFLLPPILGAWVPIGRAWPRRLDRNTRRLVWSRFRFLEPAPLISACRALFFDRSLGSLADAVGSAQSVLVLGCGWGVDAAWLLATNEARTVVGIDTDPERVRCTNLVLADRGRAIEVTGSDLPPLDGAPDAVVVLDRVLALSETDRARWLTSLGSRLAPGTVVVLRRGSHAEKRAADLGCSIVSDREPWVVAKRG
jgi:uncharacterized protein